MLLLESVWEQKTCRAWVYAEAFLLIQKLSYVVSGAFLLYRCVLVGEMGPKPLASARSPETLKCVSPEHKAVCVIVAPSYRPQIH